MRQQEGSARYFSRFSDPSSPQEFVRGPNVNRYARSPGGRPEAERFYFTKFSSHCAFSFFMVGDRKADGDVAWTVDFLMPARCDLATTTIDDLLCP